MFLVLKHHTSTAHLKEFRCTFSRGTQEYGSSYPNPYEIGQPHTLKMIIFIVVSCLFLLLAACVIIPFHHVERQHMARERTLTFAAHGIVSLKLLSEEKRLPLLYYYMDDV